LPITFARGEPGPGFRYLGCHEMRRSEPGGIADASVYMHALLKFAGHGSQQYLHPDERWIMDAGQALSAHLGAI